ncbi:MAG: heparan-alpha-glucosaminide N-acetyltransferase domain-containing protein, partial [Mucinivorans sp.]
MKNSQQQIGIKAPRIEVVDALRGFAVLAILLVHSLEHFIFPVYPLAADQPEWLNILNDGVFSITFSLFAGKAYAIFALLFGFTFYIQYSNEQGRGRDFGYRFLWRLVLLVGFATLNAAFFP